jgi:hypothetical protein
MPSVEQLKTSFILSFWATKMYLPVFLVILAGQENEIIQTGNGDMYE